MNNINNINENLTNIADSIRNKTDSNKVMQLSEFSENIDFYSILFTY